MATEVENLSPVIDTKRCSTIVVGNRINNDSTSENGTTGGSSIARYITKKVTLQDEANAIHIRLAAIRPANATIKVYAKYLTSDSETNCDDESDIEMTAESYPAFNADQFIDYSFILDDLPSFTMFAIKIVMLSSDTADVPIIRDFRVIATGTTYNEQNCRN